MNRALLILPLLFGGAPAMAQRADENAVTAADDAFGTSIGADQIGLYDAGNVRGFSPVTAGNIRVEGLSVTEHGGFTNRILSGSAVRVGITALGYPFPAPTGIADFSLRRPGDRPMASPVLYAGPGRTRAVDLDVQLPLVAGRLGLAAGATRRHDEPLPGAPSEVLSLGGVLRWRPSDAVEIKSFYARMHYWDSRYAPLILSGGAWFPPPPRPHYRLPEWATSAETRQMMGSVADARLGRGWTLRAGLFRWQDDQARTRQLIFSDVAADGAADRSLVASRGQRAASVSGEVRASWTAEEGPRRHSLIVGIKGRSTTRRYGGADLVDLGSGGIDRPVELPVPALAFGALSEDRVGQLTGGLAYQARWRGVGELSLGVQRSDYRKRTLRPGAPPIVARQQPWLVSANAAATISRRLSLYAGYTRGLEEGGVAPQEAANRNAAAPPIRTRQADAGLRLLLPRGLKLVAGLFDVSKPYVNVGPDRIYRQLGRERHRGVELSLTGQPVDGLTLVAGAVLMDAKVGGEAVEAGAIGRRPVGSTARDLRLNLDWRVPGLDAMSLNLGAAYAGERAASTRIFETLGDRQPMLPARTRLDLGARYRFRIAGAPASLRLQATNLLDRRGWEVGSGGALSIAAPRQFAATLAADF